MKKLLPGFTYSFITAMVCVFLVSCREGDAASIIKMRVNHYQSTGFGHHMTLIYNIQKGDAIGSDKWSYFYNGFYGFKYEPGYVYDLMVKVEDVENPAADQSHQTYTVQKVISKTKVAEEVTFDIWLKQDAVNNFVTTDDQGDLHLLYGAKIDCGKLCEKLARDPKPGTELWGTFKHAEGGVLKLVSLESK